MTNWQAETNCFNEYSPIKLLAVRSAAHAFVSDNRLDRDWESLRYHNRPELQSAIEEYNDFIEIIQRHGSELVNLHQHENLTLDSIYPRDALIVSPAGLILCNMGRLSRNHEPGINSAQLENGGFPIAGTIESPGTVEGGDFIWLDETHAAIGKGPRTNEEGIRQLQKLLGPKVELQVVPLPTPDHPDDVFHLMSMISPVDADLAVIYRPLMPKSFLSWLTKNGIQFVDVPETEFLPMGCNVLATGPRRVLMLDNLPQTRARLEASGCEVTVYKGDEISRKGEGGPTCLTRPLLRNL
jgi:N-dimethylarginine dimethylaminohydrolase